MLINQSPRLASSQFRQQIQVKRLSGEHSAKGFTPQYHTETITAIISPSSPNDVLLLPEGERYLPYVKIYTATPLNIGDLVLHRGVEYKIKTVSQWGDYGYTNHLAVRDLPTANLNSTGFTIT